MIKIKIISGGQTGADRAGLEAAKELGLPTGGYAPKGWRTDNGPAPSLADFGLVETESAGYPERTSLNVQASDGTLIFGDAGSSGSRLTRQLCKQYRKPYAINPRNRKEIRGFIEYHNVQVLNVAGNRERTNPGIGATVKALLIDAFRG